MFQRRSVPATLDRSSFDVVWEDEYQPWDYAAGQLLVEEAGGRVTTVEGAPLPGTPTSFVGSNGLIDVMALDMTSGRMARTQIHRSSGLSDEEIAREAEWVRSLQIQ